MSPFILTCLPFPLTGEPKSEKSYFQIDSPEGPTDKFIKQVYQLVNSTKDAVLIHYLGDDDYVVNFSSW